MADRPRDQPARQPRPRRAGPHERRGPHHGRHLFSHQGSRYLLAPRGHTQWVRNLRAAGEGELRLGRRVERFTPIEIADPDKPALIRLYLRKWAWEVGAFFDGLTADSPEADIAAAAPGFPVFRIDPAANPADRSLRTGSDR